MYMNMHAMPHHLFIMMRMQTQHLSLPIGAALLQQKAGCLKVSTESTMT